MRVRKDLIEKTKKMMFKSMLAKGRADVLEPHSQEEASSIFSFLVKQGVFEWINPRSDNGWMAAGESTYRSTMAVRFVRENGSCPLVLNKGIIICDDESFLSSRWTGFEGVIARALYKLGLIS